MRIKDYDFRPSVSKLAMEKIKDRLDILGNPEETISGRTNFFVIGDSGQVERCFEQGCHYQIGHQGSVMKPRDGDRAVVVTEGSGWKRRQGLSRELAMEFAIYLTQVHHLGRFILNRDNIDECVDKGYVISADIPAPWLQNFCIMTRHFYEVNGASFKTFSELVSSGVEPDLAYMCTMNTGSSSLPLHPGSFIAIDPTHPVSSYGGHRATRLLPLGALRRFVLGETDHDFPTTYRNNIAYSGGSIMYDDLGVNTYGTKKSLIPDLMEVPAFRALLSNYRKEGTQGEMYRPPNPFSKKGPQVTALDVTNKEFREMVIPYLNDLVKTWKAETDVDHRRVAAA